jgi:hypothetical protein
MALQFFAVNGRGAAVNDIGEQRMRQWVREKQR